MPSRLAGKRKVGKLFAALIIAAWFFIGGPASAQPPGLKEFPIQGGNGGSFFKLMCPPGTFIAGIEGNNGAVIDHMRLLCAGFKILSTTLPPFHFSVGVAKNQGEIIGNSAGGGHQVTQCGNDRLVGSISFNTEFFEDKHLIAFVVMNCEGSPGTKPEEIRFGTNFPGGSVVHQACDVGHFAVGLRGRHGSFVDAIGLICSRME
jgi:hypothetical protein